MHRLRSMNDPTTKGGADPLMTKAHSKDGNVQLVDQACADPKITGYGRSSRTWRQDHRVKIQGTDRRVMRIIRHDDGRHLEQHRQGLIQIEGERVVIIDKQKTNTQGLSCLHPGRQVTMIAEDQSPTVCGTTDRLFRIGPGLFDKEGVRGDI